MLTASTGLSEVFEPEQAANKIADEIKIPERDMALTFSFILFARIMMPQSYRLFSKHQQNYNKFCNFVPKTSDMQLQVGDIVRFLNSVGGGRVNRIEGQLAYVDDDGFETPVLIKECVVVRSADQAKADAKTDAKAQAQEQQKAVRPEPELPPVVETPEGEKLNVVLGFEASDLRHLSGATFDAYLVNDSNYYMSYAIATRSGDDDKWKLRSRGVVEPSTQVFAFELQPEDMPEIDKIAFQAVVYKEDKPFELKDPIGSVQRFDATKFFKVHCFVKNTYFDDPVIAFNLVKDDKPTDARPVQVDPEAVRIAMLESKQKTPRPQPRKEKQRRPDILEVDLHAAELLDTTAGMSSSEILNYQIDTFRKVMDANLRYPGKKIVFIHGNGEGVLRAALMKELKHRYKGHEVSDASFREYGFGATMVKIRNVAK